MPIDLKGKKYHLVSERLVKLREIYPDATIQTDVTFTGVSHAVVRATVRAGDHHATGHEVADLTADKGLPKSETTAVGRALAFLHPDLMGGEIASADEIQDWNAGKVKAEMEARNKRYGFALQRNLKSCAAIAEYLDNGELPAAWEAWNEIDEDDRIALRVASTKGGWLTVEQSKRLGEASKQDYDPEIGAYKTIAAKADSNE